MALVSVLSVGTPGPFRFFSRDGPDLLSVLSVGGVRVFQKNTAARGVICVGFVSAYRAPIFSFLQGKS